MYKIGEEKIVDNKTFTYTGYGVWEHDSSASDISNGIEEIVSLTKSLSSLVRQSVSDAAESVYVVPTTASAIIKDIHICNNLATDCHISIWIVPVGSTESNDNILFYQWNIPANDFVHWTGEQALDNAGDYIVAQSENADQITLTISGSEI